MLRPRPALQLLTQLMTSLLCFAVLSSSLLAAPTPASSIAQVSNFKQFHTALQSRDVSVIELVDDVTVDPSHWKDIVVLKRNVTIRSASADLPRLLDFSSLSRKIHILPSIWLTFSDMKLNNTVIWPKDASMYFIGRVLTFSPDSFTVFINTVLHAPVCLPLAKTAEIQGLAGAYWVHAKCPITHQEATLLDTYSDGQRCYANAWRFIQFCSRLAAVADEAMGQIGNHFEAFKNCTLLCSSMKQPPSCPGLTSSEAGSASGEPRATSRSTGPMASATAASAPAKAARRTSDEEPIWQYALGGAAAVVCVAAIVGGALFIWRHRMLQRRMQASTAATGSNVQKVVEA